MVLHAYRNRMNTYRRARRLLLASPPRGRRAIFEILLFARRSCESYDVQVDCGPVYTLQRCIYIFQRGFTAAGWHPPWLHACPYLPRMYDTYMYIGKSGLQMRQYCQRVRALTIKSVRTMNHMWSIKIILPSGTRWRRAVACSSSFSNYMQQQLPQLPAV